MRTLLKTKRQRAAQDSTVKITLESKNDHEYKQVDQTQCSNGTVSRFIQPPEPVTITSMDDETLIIADTENNDKVLTKEILSADDSRFDLTRSLFLLQYKPNGEDCFLIKSVATEQLLTVRSNTNAPMLCICREDSVNNDNENKEEKESSTTRYGAWFQAIRESDDDDNSIAYSICNKITNDYLSNTLEFLKCNQKQVGKKGLWRILYSHIVKIHIYGLNKCEIYNTAIEIGGKIYHWGINDKVNVYPSSIVHACGDNYNNKHLSNVSHAYGTLPLFLTKLYRHKTICTLIKSEKPLKKDLSQIMDGFVNEWNRDDIRYHYKHNNSNNFTFRVLKKIISNFEKACDDKYDKHTKQNVSYWEYLEYYAEKFQSGSWTGNDYANNYRVADNLENLNEILITSKTELITFVDEKKMGYEADTSLVDIIHDYVSISAHGPIKLRILQELSIDIPMKQRSLLMSSDSSGVSMFQLFQTVAASVGLLYFCRQFSIQLSTIWKPVVALLLIAATFVAHIYNPDKILEFVSTEFVEFHSFVCCGMVLYSFAIAIISFNYFHWMHNLLFAFILFLLSVVYYLVFYVYNIWVSAFTAISVPIAYKRIKTALGIQEIPNINHVAGIYDNITSKKETNSEAEAEPESKENSNLNNSPNLQSNDKNNTEKKPSRWNILSVGGNNNGNNNNSKQTKEKRKQKIKRKTKHVNININSLNYDYGNLTHDRQFEMIEETIIIDQVIAEIKTLRKRQMQQARIAKFLLFLVILCYLGRIIARIRFSYAESITNIIDYFVAVVNAYYY